MVVEIDDGFLVEAAREGDLDAFAALVRRHEGPVYRVALRMLGSEADAQDAAQETFVRAWRGLGRFRRESALSTWLYRIATRRCLDILAGRRDTQPLDTAPAGLGSDPAETAERRARLRAVTAAIGRLPPDQRAALVLREFEGLPYDAIAEVLDTTVPSIKGRIHRARLNVIKDTATWR